MNFLDNKTPDEAPNLHDWVFVKERGALRKTGKVYRSPDNALYLRTGELETIHQEADFAKDVWKRGFPVPQVTESGTFPDGMGYFIETSAGEHNFGEQLRNEYKVSQEISPTTFDKYLSIVLKFLEAQLRSQNHSQEPSQLRAGIQMQNILHENLDISSSLLEKAVMKAETRVRGLPLVLSHGDLTPFNILDNGIIDFEHRFVAPFGYDAITAVTFQRFWDHPNPDQTGTMKRWDFTPAQLTEYQRRIDALCEKAGLPAVSKYWDAFLMLKGIWGLAYEKTEDQTHPQMHRWLWRKRVALYCVEQYLSGKPIHSESFRAIGLGTEAHR